MRAAERTGFAGREAVISHEGIRRARHEHAAKFRSDLAAIFADLKEKIK